MKNSNELKNTKAEDFYYIGERLRAIRDELVENDDTTDKRNSFFSRKNVSERLGIDYSTLANLEKGTISATTFKLILYYYGLGYNPMWIIAHDNEFIPKQNLGENLVYQGDIQSSFKLMEMSIIDILKNFKSKI